MEHVIEALKAILEETRFDFTYREYTQYSPADGLRRGSLRNAKADELRQVCVREVEERNVQVSVWQHAPEELMSNLLGILRPKLEPFIDPGTGRIGHAFPIETTSAVNRTRSEGGLFHIEYQSDLKDFASGLVQAAAVMGVQSATGAVAAWCRGQPVEVRMATVLTGLLLSKTVELQGGAELMPLGLSTAELPRLPMFQGDSAEDYLGLTLARLRLSTSPALFRPGNDENEKAVRSRSDRGINFQLVRDALSLSANRHVALSRMWLEYPGAWAFCISGPKLTIGIDRPKPRRRKVTWSGGGPTVIELPDDATPDSVDLREVESTITSLQCASRKLRIAVDRWRRSMVEEAKLEDRFIDLRVALEAVYLKDFINEHSQEMRFRLALFGAWHLGADLQERRSIRKALRVAYDTASKAVHEGELPEAVRPTLSTAQDLCRAGHTQASPRRTTRRLGRSGPRFPDKR